MCDVTLLRRVVVNEPLTLSLVFFSYFATTKKVSVNSVDTVSNDTTKVVGVMNFNVNIQHFHNPTLLTENNHSNK